MLAAKGFRDVINMAGGIKAWNSEQAVGAEDVGLTLFSGSEALAEVLVVAYSLEKGLQDFYESMVDQVKNAAVKQLFKKLAAIELEHQERLFNAYQKQSTQPTSQQKFEQDLVIQAMEGGLTTREYINLYQPELEVEADVVALAMGIEAQALDLYQRASDRAPTTDTKNALQQIAEEERAHLKLLGKLLDN
jgi:sulfur-carrier protein adenylyltransferase/sulfurtransferase